MTVDALLRDPDERSQVVGSYDALSLRDAGAFDDLAAFAAELCDTPVALVSLVEDERQSFLGRVGTELLETPRSLSFCAHAMTAGAIMEVADATRDARFADNALVTGEPHLRFYAGAPLVDRGGVPLGAVCVLDVRPRTGLTAFQRRGLEVLAAATMARLEQHRTARAAEESELRFRTLADTMPQMVWSTLPDGFHDYYNARWYEFTGVPAGSTDGEGWNGMFHAEDQDRAWAVWRHSLATGDPYQIEYRLRHFDGTYRWVLGRALPVRDERGAITRWFGTCTDIHAQKLALEEREIISQELSHRIKNIFAVIAGLIGFAARARPEFAPAAVDLRQRITALGRAHDFVRPHSAQSRPDVPQDSLKALLGELFEPYQQGSIPRIAVEGQDVAVDDRSATPLALLFHELATNATKYGALSDQNGRVLVAIETIDDRVAIRWQETGGPMIDRIPDKAGFGSRLIEMSAVRQMGGQVTRAWKAQGLCLTIETPISSFRRA
ncbi:sensor histidine kinase [Sphingomonas bacterium]|uniref:sensor histidine kinase n=1 Tax=Sphingomonas bacterium TaxID=1895847 RepID=UPI001575736B|nr:PAS domain-containing protein [Sphingomonas bacterium]